MTTESIHNELIRIANALESIAGFMAGDEKEIVRDKTPEPEPKKPRAKKEKPPEPEKFPDKPTAAPDLKMSDLDMGDIKSHEPTPFSLDDLRAELKALKLTKGVAAIADIFSRFEIAMRVNASSASAMRDN